MQNPQLVTFVYQSTLPGTNARPDFRTKTTKVLGITQIIFGILLIAMYIGYIIHKAVQMYVSWTGVIVSYLSSCYKQYTLKNSPYFTFQNNDITKSGRNKRNQWIFHTMIQPIWLKKKLKTLSPFSGYYRGIIWCLCLKAQNIMSRKLVFFEIKLENLISYYYNSLADLGVAYQ